MKFNDIQEGEVYACSSAHFNGPHFMPVPAIVLQRGGWVSSWGAPYAVPGAKESLLLVRSPVFRTRITDSFTPASIEIAKQYTRAQAIRCLDALRNHEEPEEADRPPIGWRVLSDPSRVLHLTWDEWALEDARREAVQAERIKASEEAQRLADLRIEEIASLLTALGVANPDFDVYGREQVTLTFAQIEQIASRLAVDA